MRLLPGTPARRLAAALGCACAAVVALDFLVAAGARSAGTDQAPLPGREPAQAPARRSVRLVPVSGTILLATRLAAVPAAVAPVVEVFADGDLALRRPAPLATGPAGSPGSSGYAAAVVLPAARLAELGAASRGALLFVLQQWIDERPVPPDRLAGADLPLPAADVAPLLTWLP